MADVQPSQQSNAPLNSSQNSVKSSRSNASAKSDRSKSRTKTEIKNAAADAKPLAAARAKRSCNKPATIIIAASSTPTVDGVVKKPRQENAVRRSHPKYSVMVCKAIEELKERSGSSRQAILKFIMKTYDVGTDEKKVGYRLNAALRLGLKEGFLKQMKGAGASGSFRMAAPPEKRTAKETAQKSPRKSPAKTSSRLKPKVMKIAKKKPSKKATKVKTSSKKTTKAKPPKKTPRAPKTATSARASKSKPGKKAK